MIKLGLIGYPLEHSLSPRIHQAALRALKLEGEYSLFPLAADQVFPQNLSALLEQVRRGEIQGLNVTVPYKQVVIPYLDRLTPTAAAVGAVNTIYSQDQQLVGENTDVPGFLADLQRFLGDRQSLNPVDKQVLVLGAGGAARAVVFALCSMSWKVGLAARRYIQAQELAEGYGTRVSHNCIRIVAYDAPGLHEASEHLSLLVNTTPLGMWPQVDASPWLAGVPLPSQAYVYDLVYNPAQTRLLELANQAGLRTSNGIGMLVEQAAMAFECWTVRQAPRQAMLSAVSEFIQS